MSSIKIEVDEMNINDQNESQPKDRFNIAYIIFFLLGVGTLLPWNFCVTATQYFQYQLRNRSLPEGFDPLSPNYRTEIQKTFSVYLTISSLIPQLFTNFANLMLKDCLPVFFRLIASATIMLLMFILTVSFTKIQMDPMVFFTLTIITVIINNVGGSLNQGSTFGILAVLPERNSRAFLEGQGLAGIIASLANVITISASSTPLDIGFSYFLIAVCIIGLTIGLFIILFKNSYFQYYWRAKGKKLQADDSATSVKIKKTLTNLAHAMHDVRWMGFVILLTLAFTLMIFPSVFVLLSPVNYDEKNSWHTKYFIPVVVFVLYNVSDYIGRICVAFIKWPKLEQKLLLLCLALFRAAFIPLVMFCNIRSSRITPIFLHDAFPIIFVCLLGLTNGHMMTLAIKYAPNYATPGNEERCGIAMAVYISLGLCLGVLVSYGLVAII